MWIQTKILGMCSYIAFCVKTTVSNFPEIYLWHFGFFLVINRHLMSISALIDTSAGLLVRLECEEKEVMHWKINPNKPVVNNTFSTKQLGKMRTCCWKRSSIRAADSWDQTGARQKVNIRQKQDSSRIIMVLSVPNRHTHTYTFVCNESLHRCM